jgi:hypothetical protein
VQLGDLGSNFAAVSARDVGTTQIPSYVVTFALPITSCAAQVESGYAGGNL